MTKERQIKVNEIIAELQAITKDIEILLETERQSKNATPNNLRNSDKWGQVCDNIAFLSNANDVIDEAKEYLQEITTGNTKTIQMSINTRSI